MKGKKLTLLALFLLAGFFYVPAQTLSRDSLQTEFKNFINLLEKTHPDPYSGYGGKVAFHKLAFEKEKLLKTKDYTLNEYHDMILSFLVPLHDGHTNIYSSSSTESAKYISLMLKPIVDGMIINGLPTSNARYLGSRLISIDGISLDSLCKRMSTIVTSENIYGTYSRLANVVYRPTRLAQLLPNIKSKQNFSMQIRTPEGQITSILIPVTDNPNWDSAGFSQLPVQSKLSRDGYIYNILIKEKQTMYLRMKSVMSKECFLDMQKKNMPELKSMLDYVYEEYLNKKTPENIDTAIAHLPVFADIFRNMLLEMKQNNAQNLIIDLRGNGGGWTPITLPTLYMMYGDNFLNKDMDVNFYRLISPLYMEKIATTLDAYNKENNSNYEYGDYEFEEPSAETKSPEELRKEFLENAMGNASDYINDLNGKPVYTPKKVFVLTDVGTFSAAFHYAFYLWKMGAIIVGVPSAQAPNTFMEGTPFKLPYTKTTGNISNSLQQFFPSTDKRAQIFWPDLIPQYNDYKKYNFNQDTEALWLLDQINKVEKEISSKNTKIKK